MRSFAALAFVFPVVGAMVTLLILYWVIRLAVRDGILAASRRGANW